MPDPENEFSELGLRLGVGPLWIPGPWEYKFESGDILGKRGVFLVHRDNVGVGAHFLDNAGWKDFITRLEGKMSGIAIARSIGDLS